MMTSRTSRPLRRRAWLGLFGICLLALLPRLYHVWAAVAISPDGALFIEYARRMGADLLVAVRSYDQHPLYPALILLVHGPFAALMNDGPGVWIRAGQTVAMVGSLGAILALYWFAARMYGRRRALIAAAMLAVLPDACRLSADVLTDMPHLALYLAGLAAVLTGLRTGRRRYLPLAGAIAGLAFLTRPEGGAVLLVGVIGVLARRGFSIRKRVGLAGGMIALFFCVTASYQLATGKFVPKKSPTELFNLSLRGESHGYAAQRAMDPRDDLNESFAMRSGHPPVPIDVLYQWFRAGRVVYILLALLGLYVARPRGRRAMVLGLAAGIHVLLMHALEYRYDYLDRRHALVLAALSLPLAAAGAWWLCGRLAARFDARASRRRGRILIGLLAACVGVTFYWLSSPINQNDAYVVAGGRWLGDGTPPGTPIIGDSRLRRVALYADRPFVEWRWWEWQAKRLGECLRDHPRGYFVVDDSPRSNSEKKRRFLAGLPSVFGGRLELMHAEEHAVDGELRIYRSLPGR